MESHMILRVLAVTLTLTLLKLKFVSSSPVIIDSDTPDYNQMYDGLVAEYFQEVHKTTEKFVTDTAAAELERNQDHVESDTNEKGTQNEPKIEVNSKEIYEIEIKRLKCDNPWFWNTFQCAWLDFWNNGDTERLKRNLRVAIILGGSILAIVFIPLCVMISIAWFFRSRVKAFTRLADSYAEKFKPGVIVLADGTKRHYQPTEEEEEALEDLLHVLSTIT